MRPWDVVKALSETSSRLEKSAILEKLPADSEFWEFAKVALDPFILFGLRALPKPERIGVGADPKEFRKLVGQLTSRQLTGNAAKAAVKAFSETCTEPQWQMWYSRVLEKDLDCGVGEGTINKYAPDRWKFTLFSCQLASPMDNVPGLPSDAFIEAKYDGVRTLWFVKPTKSDDGGMFEGSGLTADITCYSRSGRQYHNFSIITAQLAKLVELPDFPEYGIVVDGEVISRGFNELMSQARRKTDAKFEGVLMAFDVMAIPDFLERKTTPPLKQRRVVLETLIDELNRRVENSCVMLSEAIKGADLTTEEGEQLVADFFKQQVEAGFEGIIIKDSTVPYQFDRTKHWLKKKHGDTFDLEIVGYKEGKDRHAGRLGALVGRGSDQAGEFVANVGSGFSDGQRDEIWKNRDKMMGGFMEVEADSVSRNRNGGRSLRFPVFVKFRDDKQQPTV